MLDHCKTPMGSRMLATDILQPSNSRRAKQLEETDRQILMSSMLVWTPSKVYFLPRQAWLTLQSFGRTKTIWRRRAERSRRSAR